MCKQPVKEYIYVFRNKNSGACTRVKFIDYVVGEAVNEILLLSLLVYNVLSGTKEHVLIERFKDFLGLNTWDKSYKRSIRACSFVPDNTLYVIRNSVVCNLYCLFV